MTEETPSVFDRKRLSFRRQPSANPADLSTPLELGTLLLRDLAGCQRRGFPNSGEQLAEQGEPDLAPPLLDLGDIFQGIGRESVDGLAELGPVPLGNAFEGVDPVVHHRELPARGIAAAGRLVQQAATGAHERRLADRVLRDAPRGVRAVLTDELFARPSDLQYDRARPCAGAGPEGPNPSRIAYRTRARPSTLLTLRAPPPRLHRCRVRLDDLHPCRYHRLHRRRRWNLAVRSRAPGLRRRAATEFRYDRSMFALHTSLPGRSAGNY